MPMRLEIPCLNVCSPVWTVKLCVDRIGKGYIHLNMKFLPRCLYPWRLFWLPGGSLKALAMPGFHRLFCRNSGNSDSWRLFLYSGALSGLYRTGQFIPDTPPPPKMLNGVYSSIVCSIDDTGLHLLLQRAGQVITLTASASQ